MIQLIAFLRKNKHFLARSRSMSKEPPHHGITLLPNLYQHIWDKGLTPRKWKDDVIITILKANKPADEVGSYRPIPLTSHLGKILETIVNDRINYHVNKYKLYSLAQNKHGSENAGALQNR